MAGLLRDTRFTPVLLVASLVLFFLASILINFQGPSIVAKDDLDLALLYLLLISFSLLFSWMAFLNTLWNFKDFDDRRLAWLYAIFTDLTATLITVAELYSAYAILEVMVSS